MMQASIRIDRNALVQNLFAHMSVRVHKELDLSAANAPYVEDLSTAYVDS